MKKIEHGCRVTRAESLTIELSASRLAAAPKQRIA